MSRLIVVALTFVAIFVGIGLAALGVTAAAAIGLGFVVTGAALLLSGKHSSVKDLKARLPVNITVVGVAFVAIGALLSVMGLFGSDEDEGEDSTPSATESVL